MKPSHLAHVCLFCLAWLSPVASWAGFDSASTSEAEQLLRKALQTRSKVVRGRFEYEVTSTYVFEGELRRTISYYHIIVDHDKIWCDVRKSFQKASRQIMDSQSGTQPGRAPVLPPLEDLGSFVEEHQERCRYACDGVNLYSSSNPNQGNVSNPEKAFLGEREVLALHPYFHPAILGLTPVLDSHGKLAHMLPFYRKPSVAVLGQETVRGYPTNVISLTIPEGPSERSQLVYWVGSQYPHPFVRLRIVYPSPGYYTEIDCEYWEDVDARPFPCKVTKRHYRPEEIFYAVVEIIEKKAEYDYEARADLFSFAGLDLNPGAEITDERTRDAAVVGRWDGQVVQGFPAVVPSRFPWLYALASAFLALIIAGSIAFLLYRRRLIAKTTGP